MTSSMRHNRRQGNVHVRRQLQGNTALQDQPAAGNSEPRLPHERDQSADSAGPASDEHRDVGRQAAADVRAGRQDTDIGPVLEATNARLPKAPTAKR